MGKLNNPKYAEGVQEKYVYLPDIESQQEIKNLREALEKEKSKAPVEIIKIVEKVIYKEDPELLERYNAATKELGKYKVAERDQRYNRPAVQAPVAPLEKVEITKHINVDRLVLDKKKATIIGVVSFLVGALSCFILLGK